jgi:hypothetical protein
LHHQVTVIPSDPTLERALQRDNAALLQDYLFYAFSGVTLVARPSANQRVAWKA